MSDEQQPRPTRPQAEDEGRPAYPARVFFECPFCRKLPYFLVTAPMDDSEGPATFSHMCYEQGERASVQLEVSWHVVQP